MIRIPKSANLRRTLIATADVLTVTAAAAFLAGIWGAGELALIVSCCLMQIVIILMGWLYRTRMH